MVRPLDGIRILDWTQWQMGTVATAMLADLGAEVIHIENRTTGDPGRGMWRTQSQNMKVPDNLIAAPFLPGGKAPYFECNNRGKKSITLDITKDQGKEVIYRLVKKADVFMHNFRQGVPERQKLDYETLRRINPKIIYASASGYGPYGPEAQEPAFDIIGLARSGTTSLTTESGGEPVMPGGALADQMGGIMTSYGILVALLVRERYGISQKVDASHLGSMMMLQGLAIGMYLYSGNELKRINRKNQVNPLWNYYKCQDGRWIALGMGQSDRYWPTVCKALGMEQFEKEPRFDGMAQRGTNAEELIKIMDGIFITRTSSEWMKILKSTGDIICNTVQTIPELSNDPQVIANKYIVDCHHEIVGPVKVVGLPIQLSETPWEIKCEAPELGQHTEEVLTELGGYSWEEIAKLREEEVI